MKEYLLTYRRWEVGLQGLVLNESEIKFSIDIHMCKLGHNSTKYMSTTKPYGVKNLASTKKVLVEMYHFVSTVNCTTLMCSIAIVPFPITQNLLVQWSRGIQNFLIDFILMHFLFWSKILKTISEKQQLFWELHLNLHHGGIKLQKLFSKWRDRNFLDFQKKTSTGMWQWLLAAVESPFVRGVIVASAGAKKL